MTTYKALKARKEAALKLLQDPNVKTHIRAQLASAAPPLGPSLGQRGVNVTNFCKQFNSVTSNIKQGALLPVNVHINPDRTYDLEIDTPATTWLLQQAAGIRHEKHENDEVTGKLTVKHIYEIAKIKSSDKTMIGVPLKDICQMVIERAGEIGIKVQYNDLDSNEYRKFLDERRVLIKKYLEELAKKEEAKLLRT